MPHIIIHHFHCHNQARSWLSRGMPPAVTPLGGLRWSLPNAGVRYTACFAPPLQASSSSAISSSASLRSLSQGTRLATSPLGWLYPRGSLHQHWVGHGLWGSPRCGRAPLVLTALRHLVVVGGSGHQGVRQAAAELSALGSDHRGQAVILLMERARFARLELPCPCGFRHVRVLVVGTREELAKTSHNEHLWLVS